MGIAAILGIVAAVISAAAAGYSAYVQADAAETNKRAVEAEAAYKAQTEENAATEIRNKGLEAEARLRRENAQLLSKQRAQLGASGVDIDSGSALSLQQDTVTLGEADKLEARKYFEDKAISMDMRAELTIARGKDLSNFYSNQRSAALVSGALNIGSSLAGGSSGFSSSGGSLTDSIVSGGGAGSSDNVQGVIANSDFSRAANRRTSAYSSFNPKWN